MVTEIDRERFTANPALFIEETIEKYVATSPDNRFHDLDDKPIWDGPLVGFADGNDPIFRDYKTIIGDFHLTPREALENEIGASDDQASPKLDNISVVSWVLPSTRETRLSLRRESAVPSLHWNHTRWHGQDFIFELSRYLVSWLEEFGYRAVAPEISQSFRTVNLANGLASTWSQRHVAYAAGLGTFSLNDGFITAKGIAIRAGSVVCDAAIAASPRLYENHLANCLFYRQESCRRCIQRCPAGAISEQGHDKNRCREFLFNEQKVILKQLGREEGYTGAYLGCGLCQTKVPCEGGIPPTISSRTRP